ncbi:SmpA/OmlA domain-containing protein [Pyrenophora tritici-repentis]|nr:SmpA/OmlA domain-containing protein [Pyrenophora tritici-repentis]
MSRLAPLFRRCFAGRSAIDAKPRTSSLAPTPRKPSWPVLAPSTTSTFEPDQVWYYISQTTEKYTYNRPVISNRTVTEVTFEKGTDKVAAVRTLGLNDGEQIAMNRNETRPAAAP